MDIMKIQNKKQGYKKNKMQTKLKSQFSSLKNSLVLIF